MIEKKTWYLDGHARGSVISIHWEGICRQE